MTEPTSETPAAASSVDPLAAFVDALGVTAFIERHEILKGEWVLHVARDKLVALVTQLRDHPAGAFTQVATITAADFPSRPERFEVNYCLLSMRHNLRLRLKVPASEASPVPSITHLIPGANWFEREVWDLYGIYIADHPDLRRILTDYGFDGHPMRKDFPLTGYVEMRWDEDQKRCIYEPVKLPQDFRRFDFQSPWEAMTDIQLPGDEKAVVPPYWKVGQR